MFGSLHCIWPSDTLRPGSSEQSLTVSHPWDTLQLQTVGLASIPWAEHLCFGLFCCLVIAGHGAVACVIPPVLWPSDDLWGQLSGSAGRLTTPQLLQWQNYLPSLSGSSRPIGPLSGGPQGGDRNSQAVGLWDGLPWFLSGGPKQHCLALKMEVMLCTADVHGLCQNIATVLGSWLLNY